MANGIFTLLLRLQGILMVTSKVYSALMHEQSRIVVSASMGTITLLSAKVIIAPGIMGELNVPTMTLFKIFVRLRPVPGCTVNVSLLFKTKAILICLELSLQISTLIGITSPGEKPVRGKFTVADIDPRCQKRHVNRLVLLTVTGSA